ncbi:hypothetical protein DICPUDRAFT_147399 [Dictyostelium purpureum]|uniref:Uncharacterized protein n=1 Tax=Dictyostelium purpureum TaxID=5786 RepID=F0Z8E5_DICPU|nr:uncharacterized protein DICPUDRAFT_147399 [Dictyostelium purpureum]EGC39826.1 hypothetical protein DICPUDRAFT_147399 [Dictyostelium purpureum]|eukprot:XP_003283693.1 hypothetical protein DICPUDRAFT_147399 [Dictyostelium purpureum]
MENWVTKFFSNEPLAFCSLSKLINGSFLLMQLLRETTFSNQVTGSENIKIYHQDNHKSIRVNSGSDSYFKGLKEAILDIGATFSFFISIVTVIRIPSMILSVAYRDELSTSHKKIRTNLYRHLILIPFDLFGLISYLFVLITILRIKPLHEKIRLNHSSITNKLFSIGLRLLIIRNLIIVVLEFFVMLLCIIFIISPWRIKPAVQKARAAKKQVEIFGEIFSQQMNGLVDVAVIFISLPLLISFYRLPYAIRRTFEDDRASERRKELLLQTLFVFVDIFIIFFSIIIILTIYRLPRTVRKIFARPGRYYEYIFFQFIKIFRDIPFLFMGLFVTIAVWRAPFMLAQVFKEPEWYKRRRIVSRHFVWVFIDILDIPFIISSLIILVTLWRAYAFVCGFIVLDSRKKQRIFAIKQIFYWLMDIPTFIALLFITITVYRLPKTYRQLRLYFKHADYSKDSSSINNSDKVVIQRSTVVAPIPAIYDEDNPPPSNDFSDDNPAPSISAVANNNPEADEIKEFSSWRQIVLKQLLLCIIDIPFPILTLLTLWRLPVMIQRFKEIDDPIRKDTLRRLLILRYVMLTLLDIVCIVPALFIIVTIWRIPSFVKLIKSYQRGDNEHKMFGLLFWNTLVDIPFVVMGILTLPVPWRGVFLIKTLFTDKENVKSDKDARLMAAKYLGCTLLDCITFVFLLFIGVTMWRIKSLFSFYKKEIVIERVNKKFKTTLTLFYCSCMIAVVIFIDIFKTFQVLVTILFIKQARPLYRAIQKKKEDKPDYTLEDFLPIISYYFLVTLMDIPHVFLIPIKLLGFLFLPIHMYLKKRSTQENSNPTLSFLNYPLYFLNETSIDLMNYYGLDKFFVINFLGLFIVAINELALIIVVFNSIYMFIVTLGSPLWAETRKKYGWNYLGKAQGPMVVLEYITVVLQALLFPIFILMQIAILLLPLLLALGLYPSPNLGFVEFWQDFFTQRDFWNEAKSFSSGIWIAQACWFFICVASWEITFKVGKKYFTIFSPWKAYYWLVKKVFHGKLWYCYTLILITGTRVCYRLRRACLIGEILMFPLFIIWTCWPFIIPIATKIYYIFIGSGIVTLGLIILAYRIIKENWTDNRKTQNLKPIINLSTVSCELPESGGLVFTFKGRRASFETPKIVDARLSMESEKLWETIGKVIGSTKVRAALMVVGYPISLCPSFLNVPDVNEILSYHQAGSFQVKIGIEGSKPVIKKKVLTKILNQIREVDDSPFDFVIEYGKKDFGWQKHGILIKFSTTIQNLLENTVTIDNNNVDNNDNMDISLPIRKQPNGLSTSPVLKPTPPPSRNSIVISPDKDLTNSNFDTEYEDSFDAQGFENALTSAQPQQQPQQAQPSILDDMSNYLSDDQMNEEFFRSLSDDKSNNV